MTYLWAYLAGILTLINPCVLPLLPIVLATALQASRFGPLALAAGLVLTFVLVGVVISAFGAAIGIDERLITNIAATMMVSFGVVLLIPPAQIWLSGLFSPVASGANARIDSGAEVGGGKGKGIRGQFMIGLLLGAVWSPCIGPTLGGAIGLAASGEGLLQATLTMIMFGLGVSTVMLALAYGSREVVARRRDTLKSIMPYAKPMMGVSLLLVGLLLLFHLERVIEGWLLDLMPAWLLNLSVSV
ncbi:MAG: cytochrome c-type biogenesis protein [Gammaproteobacteria bacterium]|jgi:cytochrome c-type biogenesis protein